MSKPARHPSAPIPAAKKSTTQKAVARVQRAVAIQHGGGVPKGSYVGRMQKVAGKTAN